MGKIFSRRDKNRHKQIALRNQSLRFNPQSKGVKTSPEKENLAVIRALEAQVKAVKA